MCACTNSLVEGKEIVVPVSSFEGLIFSYGDAAVTSPIEFGNSFRTIQSVTITATATGQPGTAVISGGHFFPVDGRCFPVEPNVLFSVEPEEVGGLAFATVGPFDRLSSTKSVTLSEPIHNLNAFLDGQAIARIETNFLMYYPENSIAVIAPSEVTIEKFIVSAIGILTATPVGDANEDGNVDFTDFEIVRDNFGMRGTWNDGDFDLNGTVDFTDFRLLSSNFGSKSNVSALVPEPASSTLFAIAVAALALRARTRTQLSKHG